MDLNFKISRFLSGQRYDFIKRIRIHFTRMYSSLSKVLPSFESITVMLSEDKNTLLSSFNVLSDYIEQVL